LMIGNSSHTRSTVHAFIWTGTPFQICAISK
jgi:hypothetical protein